MRSLATPAGALIAALVLLPPPHALAQADSACEPCGGYSGSSVYVTNQATIRLPPDRATIFLIVDVPAATPALASERAAQGAKAVLDTLKRVGVPAGSARLVDYGAAPTVATGGAPPVPGATYTARSVIRVELQSLELLSRVGTASFAAGATLMGPIQFGAAEMDSARRSGLAGALAQARTDAEEMAKAAGGRLGRLLDLNMNPMYSADLNPQPLPLGGPNYAYDAAAAWRTPPEVIRAWTVAGRWEVRQR
jgi:uncharacterized protein YggE